MLDATTAPKITPREAVILDLLVEGLTDKEIAARLSVSTSAVRRHLERLAAKWNRRGRVALGVWWCGSSTECCCAGGCEASGSYRTAPDV